MRVLVADDDPMGRRVLCRHLEKWGYDVELAEDGDEACRQLLVDDPPQLAVLDWMMPGRDGVDVCRVIRERTAEPYVYVLLLTARSATEDLVEAMNAGADDFVTKPFAPVELEVRLRAGRRIVELQTELIAAREALREQATRDSLTGVWNRRAVLEILDREVARIRRQGDDGGLGVLMLDLDRFKSINDTYGHPIGDAVLRETASRMRSFTRPYDSVGRYGGEEFLIVLSDCRGEGVQSAAERLRLCISETPMATEAGDLEVTASIGAVLAAGDGSSTPEVLIDLADKALYRAKKNGRNRFEVSIADSGEAP